MAPESLQVHVSFLQWQDLYEIEKPFQIFINIPENAVDQRDTNLVFKPIRVPVFNVRDALESHTLDSNGFMYRRHFMKTTELNNRNQVDQEYLPEMEALLKREVEEVDRVYFFDWRLRKVAPEDEGVIDLNDPTAWLRPAAQAHIDQSPAAALKRIQHQLKGDAAHLLKGRVRIIKIWRLLVDAVEDWPLAVCDGQTVERGDLVETDHVRRQYTGSTMYLMHNSRQRFYYMSQQSKHDVLIFKNFDSKSDVSASHAPHASFLHPDAAAAAEPRRSIEVRAFVFTYPEASRPAKLDNQSDSLR